MMTERATGTPLSLDLDLDLDPDLVQTLIQSFYVRIKQSLVDAVVNWPR